MGEDEGDTKLDIKALRSRFESKPSRPPPPPVNAAKSAGPVTAAAGATAPSNGIKPPLSLPSAEPQTSATDRPKPAVKPKPTTVGSKSTDLDTTNHALPKSARAPPDSPAPQILPSAPVSIPANNTTAAVSGSTKPSIPHKPKLELPAMQYTSERNNDEPVLSPESDPFGSPAELSPDNSFHGTSVSLLSRELDARGSIGGSAPGSRSAPSIIQKPQPRKPPAPLLRNISAESARSDTSSDVQTMQPRKTEGLKTPTRPGSRTPIGSPLPVSRLDLRTHLAPPPPPSPRNKTPRVQTRHAPLLDRSPAPSPRPSLSLERPLSRSMPAPTLDTPISEYESGSDVSSSLVSSPDDVFKSPVETPREELSASLPPALPPNKPSSSGDGFIPTLPSRTNTISSAESSRSEFVKPRLPERTRQMIQTMPPPPANHIRPPSLPTRNVPATLQPSALPTDVRRSSERAQPMPAQTSAPPQLTRRSLDTTRSTVTSHARSESTNFHDSEDDAEDAGGSGNHRNLDQPDPSFANRKPPCFRGKNWDFQAGREVRKAAISGDYIMLAMPEKLKLWRISKNELSWQIPIGDTRATAVEHRAVGLSHLEDAGHFIWIAFKDGSLHELDLHNRTIVDRNFRAHNAPITHILRCWPSMWTLDECGTLNVWGRTRPVSLREKPVPQSLRVAYGATAAVVAQDELWLACGRQVHAYSPMHPAKHCLTGDRGLEATRTTGIITCACHMSHIPDKVFFGHDDGKVSVYSRKELRCIEVLNLSHYSLSCMIQVGDYLWASFKTGRIYVYDVRAKPWRVMKEWTAHKSPISDLVLDRQGLWKEKRLSVCSTSTDGSVKVWDGMLMDDWLDAEMQRHVSDFSTSQPLRALICTWNAGASLPQRLTRDHEDSRWIEKMIREAREPEILVFGFQELVDLDDKGKAGRSVAKGFFGNSKKKDKEQQDDKLAAAYREWQSYLERQCAIVSPNDDAYVLVSCRNLVGLFSCVFVRRAIKPRLRHLAHSAVKTGLKGRYGNKGGLVVRMTIDDTSLAFVNCHLAAGQKHVVARNNDVFSVLDQADLSPVTGEESLFVCGGDGSAVMDHEVCVLNGDLNYRIAAQRSQVLGWIKEKKLAKLLEYDQLLVELRKNATHRLRSFQEAPITFMPTYKFDPGTDNYDSSEKQRVPAWCDRVYYRGLADAASTTTVASIVPTAADTGPAPLPATTRASSVQCETYRQHTCRVSDHRPVSATLSLRVKTIDHNKRSMVFEDVSRRWVDAAQRAIFQRKLDILREGLGRYNRVVNLGTAADSAGSEAGLPEDFITDRDLKDTLKKFNYDVPDAAAYLAAQLAKHGQSQ
ncbi:hypothetical protein PYCC9005_000129 [Savitreella phatthalungensis]